MLHLIFSLFLIQLTAGQTEYICTNSTITGDLQVTILVSNHYGSACDKAAPASALNPLSKNITQWSRTALPASLTIGLRVIDVCGDADKASKSIHELVPWSSLYGEDAAADVCAVTPSPQSIGLISTVQPTSYQLTSLLSKANIPLIVAKDGYQTKVGPEEHSTYMLGDSLETLIEILSKFMVALKWDFLTVVHSDDAEGVESYEVFRSLSSKYFLCIDKVIKVNSELLNEEIDTKGVVYLGSEGIGLQVLTMADLKGKTWVTALNIKDLDLGGAGVVYSVVRSGEDLLTQALAVLGEALKDSVDQQNCDEDNIKSCIDSEFKSVFVQNTEREMNHIQGENDVMYNAFRQPGDTKVATITLSELMTESSFREEPSLCDPEVTDCRSKCGHLQRKFLYIPGDWMIVMSLPIGKEVDKKNRWACVEFTDVGLFRAEAASYAFAKLRQKYPDVHGKNTGLLVLDSCGDKLKTAGIVYDLVRGDLDSEICDPENSTNCFDHTKIAAFIGDYSSAVTQKIQTVLRDIPIIHMSYGASSVTLSDRNAFPYFLRTNPPDNVQAHYMVELLKQLKEDSKEVINAVNIIYTDGLYGRTGAENVKEALNATNICVHLNKKVNETGSNNFTSLVNEILETTEDVRFIIVFLDSSDLRNFMDAVSSTQYRAAWLSRGFSFIFSDTWNDDPELLAKYGNVVKGSFSFKFNADFESTNLAKDLKNRALPTVEDVNPWLSTLEQEVGECKLRGNFMSKYSGLCGSAQSLSSFAEESYSLHMMKALTTTTLGLQSLAFNHLQSNPNYLFDSGTIDTRYDSLLRIEIPQTLEGGEKTHQPFTQKSSDSDTYGNGHVGYTIYNINVVEGRLLYVKLVTTSYHHLDGLDRFTATPSFYKSSHVITHFSSFKEQCSQSTVSPAPITTGAPNLPPGIAAAIAILGVVLCLLVFGLIAYFFLKHWRKKRRNQETTSREDHHYIVSNYQGSLSPEQLQGVRCYVNPPDRGSDKFSNGSQATDHHGHSNAENRISHSYVSVQANPVHTSQTPEDENPYMHPEINFATGIANTAYTPSEVDDTVKISDSVSNISCSHSASTASARNAGAPTPAPRQSNSRDTITEDGESMETCYV